MKDLRNTNIMHFEEFALAWITLQISHLATESFNHLSSFGILGR